MLHWSKRVGTLLILAGCSFDSNAISEGSADSAPPADATMDARRDTGDEGDGRVGDATADGDATPDAGDSATDAPMPPCSPSPVEDDVIALFTFDDIEGATSTFDSISGREGRVLDGPAQSVPGVDGCATAYYLPEGNAGAVIVADSPDWELPEGSLDFWFLAGDATTPPNGLFGRDARFEDDPGHIRMYQNTGYRLRARLQQGDTDAGDANIASPALARETWHHVGVNWGAGGFELWVDGVREDSSATDQYGIDGNDNPWVIGASNNNSANGSDPPTNLNYESEDVAIDHFRISSVRRDFSSYAALVP